MKSRWMQFREQNPKVRIRDAAKQLQVTEGMLVSAFVSDGVTVLKPDFRALMQRMPELGRVMVLTRNESCVIERKGVFEDVRTDSQHVGLVLGVDIELRMFFSQWVHGFALSDKESAGFKCSIQVFDAQGNAVIKIYPVAETNMEAWDMLVADFASPEQDQEMVVKPSPEAPVYAASVDEDAFLSDWAALQDTHDFFPMLKKYNIHRHHALQIAEGRFTRRIENTAVKTLLEQAAATGLEIMVFVGNRGNIEIHAGPVQKIVEIPGWINVMDPAFNLHLRSDDVVTSWVVEKPSADGVVTSVEVFDGAGEMIAQFFGKRKPGIPELEKWRELCKGLI